MIQQYIRTYSCLLGVCLVGALPRRGLLLVFQGSCLIAAHDNLGMMHRHAVCAQACCMYVYGFIQHTAL